MLERRAQRLAIMFVAPATIFMLAVFLIPLWKVVSQSFTTMDGHFTTAGYAELQTSVLFAKVMWNTIEISLMATVVTLLFAYPLAYYLAKQPPRRRAYLMVFVLLPFWTSVLVKSFAFMVVLGENGFINQGLRAILGGDLPIKLLFNRTGVMIGMTHYFIPFMVFPILTSLLAQSPDLPKAAQLMGSGAMRIFFKITLPLSMPGVMAGSLLTFILSLGFFITPSLMGGRKDMMMANLVDFYMRETLNWPVAAAIACLLLLLSLAFIGLLSRIPGGKSVLGEAG